MNPWKRRLSVVVLLSLTAITIGLTPALVWAQTNTFMLVPGIPGGSFDKAHAGWIDVVSLRQAFPAAQGNAQSACEIEIVKGLDIAGPPLWAAAVTGQSFAEVRIEVTQSGEINRKIYEIRLNNVRITRIVTAGDTTTAENVGLAPASMILLFFPQNPDGSPGAPVTTEIPCG